MKRILKGVLESFKEIKKGVRNVGFIVIGIIYEIDFILDTIFNLISTFYKRINKRLQKTLLFILLALASIGILNFYSPTYANEITSTKKETVITLHTLKEICNKEYTTCYIKDKAKEIGLDWKIAVAISKWETGNYTSAAYKQKNNVGGLMYWNNSTKKMELYQFDSLETGIDTFINLLKKEYIDKGLDTLEEIQKVYCPVGINDNGTNQYWLKGVTNIYKNL